MKENIEFKVFIASPSDLQSERKEIQNYINSLRIEGVYFTVNMWEDKLHATTVDYNEKGMQGIIDEELLDDSDLVIGIFKTKFGEKTNKHDSATVGEIEESIAKGKPVSLYFWNTGKLVDDLTKEEIEGILKITEFKKKYEDKGIYKEVKNIEDIKSNIKEDLQYNVEKILKKLEKSSTKKTKNNNTNAKKRNKVKKSNAWYTMSITDFINEYLRKKQFNFKYQDNITFRENLQIASVLFNHYMKSTVEQILNESRVYAFNQKYGQYNYENDLRSRYKNWNSDIIEIISNNYEDKTSLKILDVGGNSGKELDEMFGKNTKHDLSVLDLSYDAIREGESNYEYIKFFQGDMEKEYPFNSNEEFDVCLCLRAIQSRGVFRTDAIAQMTNALKIGGLIIISIPNGYINRKTNEEEKGLYDHRTRVFSNVAPIKLVEKIHNKLIDYSFENVRYKAIDTEILIWGIKREIGR